MKNNITPNSKVKYPAHFPNANILQNDCKRQKSHNDAILSHQFEW